MDINAAIERMRDLSATAHTIDPADRGAMADALADMTVVWEAIDGWLSKGGFKPSDWS